MDTATLFGLLLFLLFSVVFYLKTKKELSKQEKVFFASFKESKVLHVEASSKKNTKKVLSTSSAY